MSSSDKKNEYLRTGPQSDFQPDPNRPEKSPIVTGDTEQKQKNSDIKPAIKKTLKEFLSDKTIEQNNSYVITINDATTSIYNESFENFTPPLNNSQAENYHDIEFLKRGTSTNIDIAKGKSPVQGEPGMKDGNTLLKANNIVENAPVNPVKNWVQSQLSVNRFNESSKYGKRGRDPNFSIQKYKKSAVDQNGVLAIEGLSNVPESKQKLDISPLKMGEIAGRLLLNASGKEQSADILPGLQQIFPGLRTKSGALDVRRIAQSIVGDEFSELLGNLQSNSSENLDNFAEIDPVIDLQSVSGRGNSFGTMNNYIDKFAGGSLSSLALSVALSVATFTALLIPAAIYISAANTSPPNEWEQARNDKPSSGGRKFGSHTTNQSDNESGTLLGVKLPTLESFLGITKLVGKKEPFRAITDGITTFLNLSDILTSQGYYHVFFRNILRRTFLYTRNFIRIPGEGDIEYTFKIVNNALNIKSSGLFDALNFFATIGELTPPPLQNDEEFIDSSMRAYQTIFKKDRALEYVIDNTVDVKGASRSTTNLIPEYNIITLDRLSPEYVHFVERNFALDYVPFYFQDLKTNNLIKFNAFLNEYSDEYNPDYTDDSYFGRVEKVKIYKGTTRKVSFSFKIAAFTEQQHGAAWKAINFLTSMAYPKYDAGNQLMSKHVKWTSPFSQAIKSSPMVRVRIGDLLVNNFPIISKGRDPSDWLKSILNLRNTTDADKASLQQQESKIAAQNTAATAAAESENQRLQGEVTRKKEEIEKQNRTKESEYKRRISETDKNLLFLSTQSDDVVKISDVYRSLTGGPAKNKQGEIVANILGMQPLGYLLTDCSAATLKKIKENVEKKLTTNFREQSLLGGNSPDPAGLAKVNNMENPDSSLTIFHPNLLSSTQTHAVLRENYKNTSPDQLFPIKVSPGSLHILEVISLYVYRPKLQRAGAGFNAFEKVTSGQNVFLSPDEKIIAICRVSQKGLDRSIQGGFTPTQRAGRCGFRNSKFQINSNFLNQEWVKSLLESSKTASQSKNGAPDTAICAVTLTHWGQFGAEKIKPFKKINPATVPDAPTINATQVSNPEIWDITEEDLLASNPILRAYALNQGKGAAAYIDNVSYKISDGIPWEIVNVGERRPKVIDVSVSLTIIHDILPGINNDGHSQGWQYIDPDDITQSALSEARESEKPSPEKSDAITDDINNANIGSA